MVSGCHGRIFSCCFSPVVLYPQQVEAACGSVLIAVNIFFQFIVAEALFFSDVDVHFIGPLQMPYPPGSMEGMNIRLC